MERIELPNIRRMFKPRPGYMIVDGDLKGADAQVVAWEADDADLKATFRSGANIHDKNATDMLGTRFTSLAPDDPKRKKLYKDNKQAVHLSNYGGSARTMAATLGWLVIDAETFQRRWFSLHPNIKRVYHANINRSISETRSVSNRYGLKMTFFDRMEQVFTEAVAWIPQSTVAVTTFKGALRVKHPPSYSSEPPRFPFVRWLLQVHDSLVFEIPIHEAHQLPAIIDTLHVTTPYPDPLVIPWSVKTSQKSWGDAE